MHRCNCRRAADFVVGIDQMRRNVYNAALSRGVRVRTHRRKNTLMVQAFLAKATKAAKGASDKNAA